MAATKYKVKRNDMVMVIAGRDRGKTGKVMRVIPETGRVVIERLNIVKRHSKPRGAQSPGGIVEKEAPIHISNVAIVCKNCKQHTRIANKVLADGRRVRSCKKCGNTIE